MNDQTRNALHDFTLDARKLLLKEASEQLEGIYGFLSDGHFEPEEGYHALREVPEAAETRRRLEQFFQDEKQAGYSAKETREKLVREAAFTWLNRLVAFKMMEGRKLIRETVTKGPDSNAFKFWLTEEGNEEHLVDYERGDLPQNALGEGPRQRAYRRFLLWQCGELAKEINVLFDPQNLASRLLPRPGSLKQLVEMMNSGELAEAWEPGNEETIGWVYQAFNSEELEAAFREVRVSKRKFEAKDIPAVTCLYTPRWIVRFLVENSLGQLWLQIHPDSILGQRLAYLVPSYRNLARPPMKRASDIRLLDPACGTMHFGLIAFDLFVQMYKEELEKAGHPGWPEKPSVRDESEIPAAIVANNLYGIDIDLRSIQLSALTLFLKAKTLNPEAKLKEHKLVCANIHMLNGERLTEFLQEMHLDRRPIYRRVLEGLRESLRDSEQLGSLLRLEDEIRKLVEKERERYEKEGRQPDFFGWSKEQFESQAGRQEFWEILEVQISQALDEFARRQAKKGRQESLFRNESVKGLKLLEIMNNRYDAVVTNPPYMSARKMNARLKKLVSDQFPGAKQDLYAAFIQRCLEFADQKYGRVGMLSMHSYMFISSYQKLRESIRAEASVETLAHAGPALFDVGNPGTLQTAAYVLRREPDADRRDESIGTYFRLVKEPDGESKRRRFEQAVQQLKNKEDDPIVFHYCQGDFEAIPGSPWAYWVTSGIRDPFAKLPSLETIAKPAQGLATGDNFRFLRYWWEIGEKGVGFGCRNREDALGTKKKWFPYMKGGSFERWCGNQEYVVNWAKDGVEIMRDVDQKYSHIQGYHTHWVVKNPNLYFRRGVTYSYLTSGTFSARISPGGLFSTLRVLLCFPRIFLWFSPF